MIVIIDYGLGNSRSIQNMLIRENIETVITSDIDCVKAAERLILPGVGHFQYGMKQLRQRGLLSLLSNRVLCEKTPILGICLGAQLLGYSSEEGSSPGLGWIKMKTVAFDRSRLSRADKVPHMGWAETRHTSHPLFDGLEEPARFYYVHSYHFCCVDPGSVISTAQHGYSFPTGVANGNILGVQFHPEKSHAFGRRLLANFARMSFS